MPFVEVFIAQEQPPTLEQKRAFAVEAQQIFSEEFGTRPGSLRLAVWHLAPDDTLAVLDPPVAPEEPGAHPAAG